MRYSLLVIAAALCFGTTGTASALGPESASTVSVGSSRILIGGAALALIAWWQFSRARGARGVSATPAQTRTLLSRLPSWLLILIGAVAVVAYQLTFFVGTTQNGVAVGTIVALGSAPVITGVLSWLLDRVFPGSIWLVATALATIGVVLISEIVGASASGPDGGISVGGILASLLAGGSYAVYALTSKGLLQRGFSASGSMGSIFGLAAAFSLPILLTTDLSWLFTLPGLIMALWLGLITTTLAYLMFATGLARLPASTVATLTLAEPLIASLLGVLVLGEVLAVSAWWGIVILVLGLVVLVLPRRAATGTAVLAPEMVPVPVRASEPVVARGPVAVPESAATREGGAS